MVLGFGFMKLAYILGLSSAVSILLLTNEQIEDVAFVKYQGPTVLSIGFLQGKIEHGSAATGHKGVKKFLDNSELDIHMHDSQVGPTDFH